DNDALTRRHGVIVSGVLGCECCAFPVVDSIPVLVADDTSRAAIVALEAGQPGDARDLLLGLDVGGSAALRALLDRGTPATYREFIAVLSPDAEGSYFVYRFSDPTFVLAEGVLRALGQNAAASARWVIDVCGGSGHLTRVLTDVQAAGAEPGPGTVLADVYFSKLWLASRLTAPRCHPVCCDANHPLPFAGGTFSLAVLSDAFPYIWHKRLLAGELIRLTAPDGLVVMPHLHSSLGWNHSAGMPLTPAAYADLFAPLEPRLFRDEDLLASLLDHAAVDLGHAVTPEAMGAENALTLVASRDASLFRHYTVAANTPVNGALIVNPLYTVTAHATGSTLTLTFPTPEYADEFGGCRRYLPDTVEVPADLAGSLDPAGLEAVLGEDYVSLRRRRVLIDAPPHYV
ncbi:MAG TPA: class I SAM-dependent methyltransferase, partial [Vicinamibacterales bacterium]|nr:class I SAM-dependent methyltransferase [Vicinamibacterales bacterium]